MGLTVYLQAPVAVMTPSIRGNVKLRIPATRYFVSRAMNFDDNQMLTKSVVDANGPSHSRLTVNGRKHFGRVLESDWSFPHRVGDGKEVDESG